MLKTQIYVTCPQCVNGIWCEVWTGLNLTQHKSSNWLLSTRKYKLSGSMREPEVSLFLTALGRHTVPWTGGGYRPTTLHTFLHTICTFTSLCYAKPIQIACLYTAATGRIPWIDCLCLLPRAIMLRSPTILYIPLMYCGEMCNGQIIRGQMGLVANLETGGEGKPSSAKASFRGPGIIRVMYWLLVPILRWFIPVVFEIYN